MTEFDERALKELLVECFSVILLGEDVAAEMGVTGPDVVLMQLAQVQDKIAKAKLTRTKLLPNTGAR